MVGLRGRRQLPVCPVLPAVCRVPRRLRTKGDGLFPGEKENVREDGDSCGEQGENTWKDFLYGLLGS